MVENRCSKTITLSNKSEYEDKTSYSLHLKRNHVMTIDIETIINEIITREGEYVDHPDDKGGPTMYGITLKKLREMRKNNNLTTDDLKKLSKSEAADRYKSEYYFGPGINKFPEEIQAQVLDICVTSWSDTAIELVQKTTNLLGGDLKVDKKNGPKTIAATEAAINSAKKSGTTYNKILADVRAAYFISLAERDPKQRSFIKGWLNRVNVFRG